MGIVRKKAQQNAHLVREVRPQIVPHSAQELQFVLVPPGQHAPLQLVGESQETPHGGHWSHAIHEDMDPSLQERIQGRFTSSRQAPWCRLIALTSSENSMMEPLCCTQHPLYIFEEAFLLMVD